MAVVSYSRAGDEAKHWSYRPVARPTIPTTKQPDLVRTPVDAFLLAELEQRKLTFSLLAERGPLLRRIKFDLVGLPPTPEELGQFLADGSPDAYEKLVERLLASPHYGERWARLWLDVVRYSDTAGYNADPLRPLAWKYRDYVIDAFNADKPYDRFIQEQLAGDELFPEDPAAHIATGYLRMAPDESNASNVELARQDQLNDLVGNLGAALLAQSIACAQCHDHKFDAISQADFYRLQAFFSGLVPAEQAAVGTPAELTEFQRQQTEWLAGSARVRHELQQLELPARMQVTAEKRMKFPANVLAALDTPAEERTALQTQLCFFAERQVDFKEPDVLKRLSPEQLRRRDELRKELAEWVARRPKPAHSVDGFLTVDGSQPPQAYLLRGGTYDKRGAELQPGFPTAFDFNKGQAIDFTPPRTGVQGRRSACAKWLTDPRHPLTARVIVNRLWQAHFGRGIVDNANDFGVQTRTPSHPALLDWLASELVSPTSTATKLSQTGTAGPTNNEQLRPWSLKHIHRLIVLSTAYRQRGSSTLSAARSEFFYQYYPRRRLEAEAVRDAQLAVSGLLNSKMSGPGVLPELPPGYSAREAWKTSPDVADRQRRSIYILAKRNLPYPFLLAFDLPDMHESCPQRMETTTAPQALMLFNSELVLKHAQALAGRVLADSPEADAPRCIQTTWKYAFCREPSARELELSLRFLEKGSAAEAKSVNAALPRPFPKFSDPVRGTALVDLCHALLNANEFVYVD